MSEICPSHRQTLLPDDVWGGRSGRLDMGGLLLRHQALLEGKVRDYLCCHSECLGTTYPALTPRFFLQFKVQVHLRCG